MYKIITSYLVLSLFVPLVALGDTSRARLYIPASTNAEVSGCVTCEIKASGYSARYIFGNGFGLGLASSKATVTGSAAEIGSDYSYDTGPMIDISYTFGSDFSFTIGYGVGSSPTSDRFIPDINYKIEGKSAANSFLGLGYSFGSIEILLALRSSSASFDESYMMSFYGREMMTSWANEYKWQTTDIGIGFTF